MKTIIGSAIGVLAIGLILIGAGLRGTAASAPSATAPAAFAPSAIQTPADPNLVPVSDSARAAAGPVMVNCAPGQRALVRSVMLNGEPMSQVACVAEATSADGSAAATPMARPVSYGPGASDYRSSRTTGTVRDRRVVYQQPAGQRVARSGRSWQKRLLVIGGSTAAGAGVGGIVGGKKGALIGAALGGGASTLWEATKK